MGRLQSWRSHADVWLQRLGVTGLLRRISSHRVIILTYHRVLPASASQANPCESLVVDLEAFRVQMQWIRRFCSPVLVEELIFGECAVESSGPLVCVTFDDGYADNAEFAAPVMKEFGIRGTFFVVTDFILGQPLWFDRAVACWQSGGVGRLSGLSGRTGFSGNGPGNQTLGHWLAYLKSLSDKNLRQVLDDMENVRGIDSKVYPKAMSKDQIQSLSASGHAIGSHTCSHPLLARLSEEQLSHELYESRRLIEQWIQKPVPGLCYPNGSCDDNVMKAAEKAGYSYGCTVQSGSNNLNLSPRYALKRRMVDPRWACDEKRRGDSSFAVEILGGHDWMRTCLGMAKAGLQ